MRKGTLKQIRRRLVYFYQAAGDSCSRLKLKRPGARWGWANKYALEGKTFALTKIAGNCNTALA